MSYLFGCFGYGKVSNDAGYIRWADRQWVPSESFHELDSDAAKEYIVGWVIERTEGTGQDRKKWALEKLKENASEASVEQFQLMVEHYGPREAYNIVGMEREY